MSTIFDQAIAFVLRHEGGLVDDPADSGGLTNFGISQRAYPGVDIRALTREQAIDIYRKDYWDALRCDELPWQVAILVFDAGVNLGQPTAARLLQRALEVRPDGIIGPQTIAAVKAWDDYDALAAEVAAQRAVAYAKVSRVSLDRFGLGWYRRLISCYRLSVKAWQA